jgi:predicted nucleic acid-binding Zn ribbon protein
MPIFVFECKCSPDEQQEQFSKTFASAPETIKCAKCGGSAKRVIGRTGVAFGNGFFAQNYASHSDRKAWIEHPLTTGKDLGR